MNRFYTLHLLYYSMIYCWHVYFELSGMFHLAGIENVTQTIKKTSYYVISEFVDFKLLTTKRRWEVYWGPEIGKKRRRIIKSAAKWRFRTDQTYRWRCFVNLHPQIFLRPELSNRDIAFPAAEGQRRYFDDSVARGNLERNTDRHIIPKKKGFWIGKSADVSPRVLYVDDVLLNLWLELVRWAKRLEHVFPLLIWNELKGRLRSEYTSYWTWEPSPTSWTYQRSLVTWLKHTLAEFDETQVIDILHQIFPYIIVL